MYTGNVSLYFYYIRTTLIKIGMLLYLHISNYGSVLGRTLNRDNIMTSSLILTLFMTSY